MPFTSVNLYNWFYAPDDSIDGCDSEYSEERNYNETVSNYQESITFKG